MRKGKPGSVYNIAGGNELANLELVKKILKAMNKPESLIEFVEDRPGHDRRYSIDDGKIREELGWRPRNDFGSGLKETIQWYLKNEDWWRPIANERTLSPAPWKLEW
jgi:dTDP-glucose 4,6-dehydratase